MVERKQLKDYPLNEWMEAADGCEYCGAKAKVMVTFVDESGNFGDVHIEYQHEDSCHCLKQRKRDYMDVAGWVFSDRTRKIKIAGKEFPALKGRLNTGPCLSCWKFVVGVPLILFPPEGDIEFDFCFPCAGELGILDTLKGGLKPMGLDAIMIERSELIRPRCTRREIMSDIRILPPEDGDPPWATRKEEERRCVWHKVEDGFFCFHYLNRRLCNPEIGKILEGINAKPYFYGRDYYRSNLSREEYLEKHFSKERDPSIKAQKHSRWR